MDGRERVDKNGMVETMGEGEYFPTLIQDLRRNR